MPWYDYVKIAGLDTSLTDEEAASLAPPEPDPADLAPCPAMYYEVFQGSGGGESTGTAMSATQWTEGAADYKVSTSLWAAQTRVIQAQTTHLEWLKARLEEDSAGNTGIVGLIKNFSSWVISQSLKIALGEYIEKQTVILEMLGEVGDDIADTISAAIVDGAVYLIDFFEKLASPGGKECGAMIDENNAILELTVSAQNYQVRQEILNRHQTRIIALENTLKESSGALYHIVEIILDVIKTFHVGGESDESWKDTFDAIEGTIGNMDEWVAQVFTADAADPQLPVPMPPQLPALPDKAKKQPSKAVIYYAFKIGIKLFTEWLRRHKEHDPDAAEALENALYFTDIDGKKKSILQRGLLHDGIIANTSILKDGLLFTDTDNKDKGTLERAFLYENQLNQIVSYLSALPDLAYVDETIDFGAFRINLRGKTIQYG